MSLPVSQAVIVELRDAREQVSAGMLGKAELHLLGALRLFEEAPRGLLPTVIGNYISEAGQALLKSDKSVALRAIDGALYELEVPGRQG
jgi:hypothetical protein